MCYSCTIRQKQSADLEFYCLYVLLVWLLFNEPIKKKTNIFKYEIYEIDDLNSLRLRQFFKVMYYENPESLSFM
jgi:hypothetical protein